MTKILIIFYFFCQRIILNNFSSDLHNVTNDMLSFFREKRKKFRVCCCIFDSYFYKLSTGSCPSFYQDIYKSKDIDYIFILCTIDYYIHVCYKCVYNTILIRRFDEIILNQTLRRTCYIYISYSSFLEKTRNTAKKIFQNIKYFLTKDDTLIDRNCVMSHCCFECFKDLVCNFLYGEFYTFYTLTTTLWSYNQQFDFCLEKCQKFACI